MSVKRLMYRLKQGDCTWAQFLESMNDIDFRFMDEMSRTQFFVLSAEERRWFEPDTPLFGKVFEERFPSRGVFELNEAAQCMALGRHTAAVFHLMRVMEVGIRALARCLDIEDPLEPSQRNWGRLLGRIKDGINLKWPSAAAKTLAGAEIFDDLYVSLDAVKNPWRNATMHVDNKYTAEEAEHIFYAVRGFMGKLASRMDEDGNPKA